MLSEDSLGHHGEVQVHRCPYLAAQRRYRRGDRSGDRFDRTREEERFLSDRQRTSNCVFVLAYSQLLGVEAEQTLSLADVFHRKHSASIINTSPRPKPTPQGPAARSRIYLRDHHLMSLLPNRDQGRSRDESHPNERTVPREEKIDRMLLVEAETDLTSPRRIIQRVQGTCVRSGRGGGH